MENLNNIIDRGFLYLVERHIKDGYLQAWTFQSGNSKSCLEVNKEENLWVFKYKWNKNKPA